MSFPGATASNRDPRETGITLIEVLIALTIALTIALAAYEFLESTRHTYVTKNDLANAQSSGRAALDLLSTELRGAGYSPLGVDFDAISLISATQVRLWADHDGDGDVGTAGELNEKLEYVFSDPNGDGVFELRRGVDLNEDGDFEDSGESVDVILEQVLPVDIDGDGTLEPFIAFDEAAPHTRHVTVSFGVRTVRLDRLKKQRPVVSFTTDVILRNKSNKSNS